MTTVDTKEVESRMEEETRLEETGAQKKERDQIEKHKKRKLLVCDSVDSADTVGKSSTKRDHESEKVFIYAMDTEEDPPPLIVEYEGSVSFDMAYEVVCGLMKCASGRMFQQGTEQAVNNLKLLPPGNYDFMVFPGRGDRFPTSSSSEVKSHTKFLSCKTLLVNDREKPLIRIPTDLVIASACNLELIISRRQALQLQLEEEKEAIVLGSGGYATKMVFYRSVLVCILHEDGKTVYKRADLTPASKFEETEDTLVQSSAGMGGDDGMDLSVDEDFNKITLLPNPNLPSLKLSLKEFSSPCLNSRVPHALLGLRGLEKLGFIIDFENLLLF